MTNNFALQQSLGIVMAVGMKQLTLMRHGKAVREHEAPTDHERSLVDRGRREAVASAEWLTGWGVAPDLVLVSDASRTLQTWQSVRPVLEAATGKAVEFRELTRLYLAEPEELWEEIGAVANRSSVLVIGHNPGLHQLAMWLSFEGGAEDPLAMRHLSEGLPTAGGVVFEALEDGPPTPSSFRLKAFCAPRV
jgi:phosphohistidine phosphatase